MVVTRFAPSPTGMLHIGGVRTVPFSWLQARRHGGRFILRTEGTDRERPADEAVRVTLEGMAWLGLELTRIVSETVFIPVIAVGDAGDRDHLRSALRPGA